MPKYTGDDVYVSVNGVVLSDHVDSADVKDAFEAKNVTGMGANAQQNVLVKAKTSTIDIDFIMDYGASLVDQTLRPLVGSNSPFTVIVRPTSATASTTNPQWTLMALLPDDPEGFINKLKKPKPATEEAVPDSDTTSPTATPPGTAPNAQPATPAAPPASPPAAPSTPNAAPAQPPAAHP